MKSKILNGLIGHVEEELNQLLKTDILIHTIKMSVSLIKDKEMLTILIIYNEKHI